MFMLERNKSNKKKEIKNVKAEIKIENKMQKKIMKPNVYILKKIKKIINLKLIEK